MFDPKKIKEIEGQVKTWNEKIEKSLSKNPERKKEFQTASGIPVHRVFTPEAVPGLEYLSDLNLPGEFPYTRGIQPTMYRGRFWTMRQYAGFGTAEDTNQRYRYLLKHGQTGLSVAFDLPTQIGYDSDHPLGQGEVGKVGVAIDSVKDMEVLFDQIPLEQVSTSMTINAPASILLAMYLVVGENKAVTPDKLNGTIQNDILKEYTSRGTYIFPPKPSMRIITNIFEYCTRKAPNWNTISISGYHMREAGCTAVQEVAFTLSNGMAYVEAAQKAGLDVDVFAPRLSFFFNAHLDFLEEIAKFRAARRLWAKLMKERFKAKNPRSWMLRFHTQTAGCTLTAQQPYNNIIRVAWQALAAVLGGTQSLHTNSMDEALALPSEPSVQIALRTQQLIAHESGAVDTADPLGGSFYLEYLTDGIEKRARDYIAKIDQMGGSVAAIEKGFIQQEIQESAYRYQREVETSERVIVGVNKFQTQEPPPQGLLKVDPRVRERQIQKLAELKGSRDGKRVQGALTELKKTAQGEANLMEPILNCVRALCTLGEICDILREVFGEYEPTVRV
jgi:methylmalonyl-CoA mutase N-terminal domain/subunit